MYNKGRYIINEYSYCLVTKSHPTFCDPMHCSLPGSSVCGVSRQEHGSVLLFPSPWDLDNSGIKPASPALAGGFFIAEPPVKPKKEYCLAIKKNKIFPFAKTRKDLDGIMLSEISDRERQIPNDCTYM